jgi:hypothetical protein
VTGDRDLKNVMAGPLVGRVVPAYPSSMRIGARPRDIASGNTGIRTSVEQADYLRWRIERPDGRRSLTWFATTSARGKLLIGSHQLIGTLQLSFLQGSWLIECSGDFTRRRLPPENDESICDYWMRAPKINDWYQASVILFPATTLAPMFQDEPPCSEVRKHRWDYRRSSDDVLEVQILFGGADCEAPAISDGSVLIGHVDLHRGVAVAVVAEARAMDIYTQRMIEGHRALATTSWQARRYAWGTTGDVPCLIDLAGLRGSIRV